MGSFDDFEEVTYNAAALNLRAVMEKLDEIDHLSERAQHKDTRYLPKYQRALRILSGRLRTFSRVNGQREGLKEKEKELGGAQMSFNDLEESKGFLYDMIADLSIGDRAAKSDTTKKDKIKEAVHG